MGLCNVYSYQLSKTIKLNDTYEVSIRLNEDDKEGYTLYECSSVILPTYKPKTETYQYGNNVKTFIYPDYQSLSELELELIEHYTDDKKLAIQQLVNMCLHKLFDVEHFAYKLDDYIYEIKIKVLSNDFSGNVIEHVFRELKLVDYNKYSLDYSSNELTKWSLKFTYRSYSIESIMDFYNNEMPETNKIINIEEEQAVNSNEKDIEDYIQEEKTVERSSSIDYEAMYNNTNLSRASRGPAEDNSMLLSNASNIKTTIEKLTDDTTNLANDIKTQQTNIKSQKSKIDNLSTKLAEAEKRAEELSSTIKENETIYNNEFSKTQSLIQATQQNKVKDNSSNYWFKSNYDSDLKKQTEVENALNKNLETRKSTVNIIKTAKEDLATTNATIAKLKESIKKEQNSINNKNNKLNTLKTAYNKNIKQLEELENINKNQIESLENRYGSMQSIEQRNKNANMLAYSESLSTTNKAKDTYEHNIANKKAETSFGRTQNDIYNELHELNEAAINQYKKEEQLKATDEALHRGANNLATTTWSKSNSEKLNEIHDINEFEINQYKKEEQLKALDESQHIGANNLATIMWSKTDTEKNNTLHNMNETNKISFDAFEKEHSNISENLDL